MRAFAPPAAIVLIVAVVLLEGAARAGLVPATVFPAPSAIAAGFVDIARNGELAGPALITFGEALAATLIGVLAGVPAGIALARSPSFGRAYESWLGGLFAAPIVLLYPLFLVVFHRSSATIVIMGAITAVLPIVIQTRTGMLLVPPVLSAVGRSFNATARQGFWLIAFPAAVPAIVTGVRLALIYSLVNTIGLEFLIDFGGLGRVISDLYAQYDIPQMYAGIVTIVVLSLALLWLLDRAERRLRPA
jgi:NitT/TauT family transport system permease protein